MENSTILNNILFEMRHIFKNFGPVVALEDMSLSIQKGEVVALLGDNGAGKSTAVKIISGVYQPSSGEMFWEGSKVNFKSPEDARAIGIQTVYQDLALINTLSICRNFFLHEEPQTNFGFLKLLNLKKMKNDTREILHNMGIKDLNPDSLVSALSGGERQAIAIGRAYYFGGKLLILDEPTAALSVKQTQKVFSIIEEVKSRGASVILIEHNMIHAHEIADRIIIIRHGRVHGEFLKNDVSIVDLEQILAGYK